MSRPHKYKLNPRAKKRASKAIESADKARNIELIKKLAKQGLNKSRIAREINYSQPYVHRLCEKHNITTTRKHSVITQKEIDKIKTMATYCLVTEIYEKSGIPKDVVKEIMLEHNIKAKGSVLGRKSKVRKEVEAKRNINNEISTKKMDVFDAASIITKDLGYDNNADYVMRHGKIDFQQNIKSKAYQLLDSIQQSNTK